MFEKFKEKCKSLSRNRAAIVTFAIILLALTVILSVSIATNRAKKKFAVNEVPTGTQSPSGQPTETEPPIEDGTVEAPTHQDTEKPVSGNIEEFKISLPVNGVISKGHDSTIQVWSETMGDYRVHLGIDIASDEGAPVYAAADGTVSKIWDDALMGRCIAISHGNDVYTFYKNLDATFASGIKEGSTVTEGDKIGEVGNTAIAELADEPHVHIEMTIKGLAVDPRDYFNNAAKESITQNNSGK